jgi:hypothetical protein
MHYLGLFCLGALPDDISSLMDTMQVVEVVCKWRTRSDPVARSLSIGCAHLPTPPPSALAHWQAVQHSLFAGSPAPPTHLLQMPGEDLARRVCFHLFNFLWLPADPPFQGAVDFRMGSAHFLALPATLAHGQGLQQGLFAPLHGMPGLAACLGSIAVLMGCAHFPTLPATLA